MGLNPSHVVVLPEALAVTLPALSATQEALVDGKVLVVTTTDHTRAGQGHGTLRFPASVCVVGVQVGIS